MERFPYMETIKDKQYSDQQISDHKQKLDDPEQAAAALVQVTHQIVDRHITAGVEVFCDRCDRAQPRF